MEEPILRWFSNSMDGGGIGFHFPGDGNPGSLCVFQEKVSGKKVILRLLILLYAFPALLSMTAL